MMQTRQVVPQICCLLAMMSAFSAVSDQAQAQVSSLSSSLSDPLSDQNQTEGFDSTFDPGTSNFSNPTLHSDVSDPTHSQLLGSSLTPMEGAFVSPYAQTSPQTGTVTDAQSVIGAFDIHFGNRQGQGFNPSAGIAGSQAMRQSAAGSLGSASMQAAFSAGGTSRGSYSGFNMGSSGVALPSAGQSASSIPSASGIGMLSNPQMTGTGNMPPMGTSSAYLATDPVLTGSTLGYEGGLGLNGDLPSPSTQTAQFFMETGVALSAVYAFDDGQTPMSGGIPLPGAVLPTGDDYAPSPTGFPDSTRGLAGLATEASNAVSPLSTPNRESTLFAAGDEGVSFAPQLRFVPSLHTIPVIHPKFNFEAVERREQEQRILHGFSISQASEIYKEDLRKYRQVAGRPLPPRPRKEFGVPQNSPQDIMGATTIR